MDSITANTSNAPVEPSELEKLQSRFDALSELSRRLTAVRPAPAMLLRMPQTKLGLNMPMSLPEVFSDPASVGTGVRNQVTQLRELVDIIAKQDVQDALKDASERYKKDPSDLSLSSSVKRKRSPSPLSPQPYQPPPNQRSTPFPNLPDTEKAISGEELRAFIRRFNKATRVTPARLALWCPSAPTPARRRKLPESVVLSLAIEDVLHVYVTLDNDSDAEGLVVENVECFGPREKKGPHLQSDHGVFQTLTQELAKTVHSYPSIALQQLTDLLLSHARLFLDPCTKCSRILSAEAQMPPVIRLWHPPSPEDSDNTTTPDGIVPVTTGTWEPRHVHCL